MRTVIFYFLATLFPLTATCQPVHAKKILTVEGFAERTVRADEIYYSISSLTGTSRLLRTLDEYLHVDSVHSLPAIGRSRSTRPVQTGVCVQADSILRHWLTQHGAEAELVEQELFDELGVPAASDRFLLKIKSIETFKSLLARLEACPCFIGELVRVGYSNSEKLRHELTLAALRDARKNAGDMLSLFGCKIRAVDGIAPAKVVWTDALSGADKEWSPFDPKLNRSLEVVCQVRVSVQFRFKK